MTKKETTVKPKNTKDYYSEKRSIQWQPIASSLAQILITTIEINHNQFLTNNFDRKSSPKEAVGRYRQEANGKS